MSAPAWPAGDGGGSLGDGRFASATHHPSTVAEVQAIVRDAGAAGLAVYPQGGGTALDHGGLPGRPGVAVRTGGLDQIIDYPAADMTITVEAGATLGAIRAVVAGQGQRLAIEAAWPEQATLGGIFATASTGPRRFGWGRPRDQVIGIAFVTSAGELVRGGGRVVKNVAGYDFPKLLTGSLGTLGIITELTLKVNPRPVASALVEVDFPTCEAAATALDALNISGTRPVALELVGPGTRTLLIGLEGNEAAVEWQVARLGSELGRGDLPVLRDDAAERAWRDFVAEEADLLRRNRPGTLGFVASFAPSAALRFAAGRDSALWSVRVHAGNGVVRGVSLAGIASESEAATVVDQLRGEAARLGGSLVLAACPAAWKARLGVWGPRRPDWEIAERVKLALDPGHVLNPGRFVGII